MSILLERYRNGNYTVELYDDGTKIRYTNNDEFISEFPENIDVKITNYCDAGCAYCHENSTVEGLHGDLNAKFFDTLRTGTELAIGGGNPLSHPKLVPFLRRIKDQGVISNLTVNQIHFEKSQELIDMLVTDGLIKGLGISFMRYSDKFIRAVQKYDNAVLHVINGVVNLKELEKLYNSNLKLLILGYKYLRRGESYYSPKVEDKKQEIYDNIHKIIKGFKVVSFDNLAIEQLNIRRLFTKDDWEKFYMGDDGNFTMYVDVVKKEFAISSTSLKRYKLMDRIDDMFKVVKSQIA
jgi:organic radical activating enzyme